MERSISLLKGRNTKKCIHSVEVTSQFIDSPNGLRGAATWIISVETDFCPEGTNGAWDKNREGGVQTLDPRQSEIIGGLKEAHHCSESDWGESSTSRTTDWTSTIIGRELR
ncbi:hypothetical protein TNCV_2435761 [Trichonephila clavipes]|nr:hypothetical protein TNCV_2435761 [Trichonephila clavipes]